MTHPLSFAQAFLFVPANRPDRFAKSLATRAHAVIVDLEDAVPLSDKDAARDAIRRELAPFLKQCPERIVVRINACGTPYLDDDLRLVDELGIRHLMLPKTESAEQLTQVSNALSFTPVLIPMIESAKGVDQLKAIAAHPNTLRLSLGNIDLQFSFGLQCGPDELELLPVRYQILLASRLAEIAAPIDGVTVQIESDAQLQADILRGKRLGFQAKLCIHPKQVDAVIDGFQPSAQEVEHAQAVVAADKAANGGVVQLNGKMVDRPRGDVGQICSSKGRFAMNLDTLLLGVADGVSYAGLLFLMSLGLTLIFGVLGVLNIAHGSLYAFGGYTAASITSFVMRHELASTPVLFVVLLVAAVVVGVVMGLLLEVGLLRYFQKKRSGIATLGHLCCLCDV